MPEQTGDLIQPTVNPQQIGLRPDAETKTPLKRFLESDRVRRLLRVLPGPQKLSENETVDLQRLDTGELTLEKIKGYANDQAKYWEFYRGVKLSGLKKARFEEAIKLKAWLDKDDWPSAARYFLDKAKASYSEATHTAQQHGTTIEAIAKTFEDGIRLHIGEISPEGGPFKDQVEAIHESQPNLVIASGNFVMNLKRAAVLAKEIVKSRTNTPVT